MKFGELSSDSLRPLWNEIVSDERLVEWRKFEQQRKEKHPAPPVLAEFLPLGRPKVAILAGVYNGREFLQQQIDTWASQPLPHIDVWVSDDGSTDTSGVILLRAAKSWSKGSFRTFRGPGRGFAENYRSLLTNKNIIADYYAFSDQDDVWDGDKLQAAIDWLGRENCSHPRVFGSRTRIMNAEGGAIGLSPLFSRPPSFRNALVQNIAGGNTLVMNHAARELLAEASRRHAFVAHDWWTYLIVTGAGGTLHYSATPHVGYRQHGNNMIGENNSWRARWTRVRLMLAGRFSEWNGSHLAALRNCDDLLTDDAREVVRLFSAARSGGLARRIKSLIQSGVYRQTAFGQMGLWVACVLKRL